MDPVQVLMVEDNNGDVVLVKEAMTEAELSHQVTVVRDGVEAMEYLRRCGPYALAPTPDLIVLDLKLPRKSGREVLDEIQADPALREIPLVLLSSSKSEMDLARAYELPAECYLAKPGLFEEYVRLVRSIEAFRQEATKGGARGGRHAEAQEYLAG